VLQLITHVFQASVYAPRTGIDVGDLSALHDIPRQIRGRHLDWMPVHEIAATTDQNARRGSDAQALRDISRGLNRFDLKDFDLRNEASRFCFGDECGLSSLTMPPSKTVVTQATDRWTLAGEGSSAALR
jgi:hypothetical protein